MSDPLHFKLVDAFSMTPCAGNVAGVVFEADQLTDRQMQAIALEFNAAETTFILKPTVKEAAVRFRWFTPGCEVNFCGHATLGGVHALLEEGCFAHAFSEPGTILPIETRSGILSVRTQKHEDPNRSGTIWLDMPHSEPKKTPVNLPPLLPHLGIREADIDERFKPIRTHDDDIMLAVRSLQTLLEMRPSMAGIVDYSRRAGGLRGIFVTTLDTLTPANVCQSRFFAPAAGVDEDPVTGSAHGPLGLHLVRSGLAPVVDGRSDFLCVQGKAGARSGVVRVVVIGAETDQPHIRIGGQCVTTARGTLERLPPA